MCSDLLTQSNIRAIIEQKIREVIALEKDILIQKIVNLLPRLNYRMIYLIYQFAIGLCR